jgi:hypothetical protein
MHHRLARATLVVLYATAVLGGCRSRGTITGDATKPERLAPPADSLPPIKSGAPMTPARFSVNLSKTALSADGLTLAPLPLEAAWTHGFDAKYKRSGPNDLYVVALANAALSARQNSSDGGAKLHEARLAVDGAIPFRLFVEVLFTLGQTEFDTFELVAPSAGGRVPKAAPAQIVVHPPRVKSAQIALLGRQADEMQLEMLRALQGDAAATAPPQPPMPMPKERPSLDLAVLVVSDGMSIKARGGNVGPGCNDVGPGLAIPKAADGRYDFAALAACLVKVKASTPDFADEHEVTVAANADVPYSVVLQTVDAVRGEKADVLPDVMFGVPR